MSKWEAFSSNVFEDGDYAFPCESPEQAGRIVKLLEQGEADGRRLDWRIEHQWYRFTRAQDGFVEIRDISNNPKMPYAQGKLISRGWNEREAIDSAIAAAPASKETRSGTL